MRVTMGIVGVLGLGVTVAVAQPPAAAPTPARTATLLPPQPLGAADVPPVARASAEGLPSFTDSTPVTRITPKAAGSPAWLNGTDSAVRPASGTVSNSTPVRQLTPPTGLPREEPSLVAKGYDKLRSALAGERPPAPGSNPGAVADAAQAMGAFRGTTTSGAPVYAGPPAYRWYGWGSVTPGANTYAPTGQYPKASANWYAITGATPGAFPVPVVNPMRPAPGTEPPAYVTTPAPRIMPAVLPAQAATPTPTYPAPQFMPPSDLSKSVTTPETPPPPTAPLPAFNPPPRVEVPAAAVPQPPPARVSVPTLTPVPLPPPSMPAEPRVIVAPSAPTIPVVPAVVPSLPPPPPAVESKPAAAVSAPNPGPPAPLPMSVTDDQPAWQPTNEKPSAGQWTPTTKAPGTPQSSTVGVPAAIVARGQMDDRQPDPVATLIRKLCEGRATGVDVRWTGSKKLTVCFECTNAPAAQQLVKDICARPELGPLQIDFCVLVK